MASFVQGMNTHTPAQAEALLTKARRHLQAMEQEMRHMAARRERDSSGYRDLESQRSALEKEIRETESMLAEFVPEHLSTASGKGLGAIAEVPPAIAGMPKFRGTLGLPSINGAVSSGPEVENLQKILCWQGFEVPVDGRFSMRTQQALVEWQKQMGIRPDGVVGAATRRALNALIDPQSK